MNEHLSVNQTAGRCFLILRGKLKGRASGVMTRKVEGSIPSPRTVFVGIIKVPSSIQRPSKRISGAYRIEDGYSYAGSSVGRASWLIPSKVRGSNPFPRAETIEQLQHGRQQMIKSH